MFRDLRIWPARRLIIATGVAIIAIVGLVLASGLVGVSGGGVVLSGDWWSIPAAVAGSALVGLIIASYIGTPIGADATLCDTRWPAFGLIALSLSADVRSAAPLLTGVTRPVVAVAAMLLLVWALRERLVKERRATARLARTTPDEADGEVCTTCRPLFPRAAAPTLQGRRDELLAPLSPENPPHQKKVAP